MYHVMKDLAGEGKRGLGGGKNLVKSTPCLHVLTRSAIIYFATLKIKPITLQIRQFN